MKILVTIILFVWPFIQVKAQEKLIKDIDFDGKNDTVYVDTDESVIICRLSTQQYKSVKSQPIEILNAQSGVSATKNGFEFYNHWMRAGYHTQFRYDKPTKKIRLIGMSRYEFGPANNDGSGESSVNLLTGDYIGDWNFYDHLANNEKGELIKIPTIKTKMRFDKIYLSGFSDKVYFDFSGRCAKLYYRQKKLLLSK
ncbi:hypothetical protein [Polluticaenibacter yanchengensis]|uniref:Uncharacterized protein n=1 Tax=Polluticaenibacter yanchengensis TaxID=3014562 RepID=A0ABT4UGU6_9BACT|nr:hypothetical protein [Chitinophagaceae bacterium LY-5]